MILLIDFSLGSLCYSRMHFLSCMHLLSGYYYYICCSTVESNNICFTGFQEQAVRINKFKISINIQFICFDFGSISTGATVSRQRVKLFGFNLELIYMVGRSPIISPWIIRWLRYRQVYIFKIDWTKITLNIHNIFRDIYGFLRKSTAC